MLIYRLCRATHKSLDGEGARLAGGRWNSPGRSVVYTSSTLALAALEALVHFSPSLAPRDLVALTLDVPDDVGVEDARISRLPKHWFDHVDIPECRAIGDAWVGATSSALLRVPAAPVPREFNYLINPLHADAARVKVVDVESFRFDPRLIR
jgi:RES domain-containing protein